MADSRTCLVWGEAPPVAQLPVRSLEDELVGAVVITARPRSTGNKDFVCVHCGECTKNVDSACRRPACLAMRVLP